MDTTSHWLKTAVVPRFPSLDGDLTVDVAIVGAGITGITAAYLLRKAGLSVALIERGRCAQVDTGHTTAHLTAVTDLRLSEIQRRFGDATAKAVWDAGTTAIQLITNLVQTEDIACELHSCPGHLHAARPDEDPKSFQDDAKIAAELGINASFTNSVPFFRVPGVTFPNQALFHPRKYLAGLLHALNESDCHVFEETAAGEIDHEIIHTPGGRIRYKHLVLATHNPLMGETGAFKAALFQTKLSLYTSYAIGARIPFGSVPEGCYWDTNDPYYYLRVHTAGGYYYAIYGGEDHKTGQETDTPAVYRRLEEKMRQHLPHAAIDSRWSGQVIETADGLPYIGATAAHQFVATGFAGNGMTFGTIGAMMAVDGILERPNPWKKIFDPHRKAFHGAWSYLKENKDYPVCLVRDHLAKPEVDSVREVGPGEGKVVRMNHQKVAAYRDPDGRLTLCSAICTHLQCVVGWNAAERTWDCPCHGSRFRPDGSVISGPAEEPLPRISAATGEAMKPRRTAAAARPPEC